MSQHEIATVASQERLPLGWVNDTINTIIELRIELRVGRTFQVRRMGGSMRGGIEIGLLDNIVPVDPAQVQINDVVLATWMGSFLQSSRS